MLGDKYKPEFDPTWSRRGYSDYLQDVYLPPDDPVHADKYERGWQLAKDDFPEDSYFKELDRILEHANRKVDV
jgi:hypothetical protein